MFPLIPLAINVGGAIAGHFFGKQSEKNAMKRTPEEQFGLQGAQGMAKTAGQTGTSLLRQGQSALGGPTNYYNTLLSGNRAAMAQAVAPDIKNVTGVFRGAERGYDRAGLRGAARDVATADLGRERASALAGLTTGVRPAAANAMASLGTSQLQLGGALTGQAGNVYQNLLQQGFQNKKYGRDEGRATSQQIGRLTASMANMFAGPGQKTSVGDMYPPMTPPPGGPFGPDWGPPMTPPPTQQRWF